MTDKQIQTEVVRLVNDVEYAALGFHATGGVERCIRAKEELHGYIAQLERIAGDLQTLCDKQALMLGERDAQLEAVGAGGVGAMMPKQLAVECYECGATHRPGENTLCPTFRPQQIAAPAAATGWKWVPLEPTPKMVDATFNDPEELSRKPESHNKRNTRIYRAMLAAAPQPQQIAGLEKDAEITALKAERDALLAAAKYAEHIDAAPETQLQTMLHDTLTERDALRKDALRLDWLDQNIFSRENINFMGQLDPTMNMWVTFSPKGHQGSARNILDAAMQAQTVQP